MRHTGTRRLERLVAFPRHHRWLALLTWVVVLLGVTAAAQAVGSNYRNGSDISLAGTQSQQVADLLARHAPAQTGDSVTVVLHDERGWDADVDVRALDEELAAVDHVRTVTPPDARQGTVSPDGTLGLVQVALDTDRGAAPKAASGWSTSRLRVRTTTCKWSWPAKESRNSSGPQAAPRKVWASWPRW